MFRGTTSSSRCWTPVLQLCSNFAVHHLGFVREQRIFQQKSNCDNCLHCAVAFPPLHIWFDRKIVPGFPSNESSLSSTFWSSNAVQHPLQIFVIVVMLKNRKAAWHHQLAHNVHLCSEENAIRMHPCVYNNPIEIFVKNL